MRGAGRCGARFCSPAPQLSPPLPSSPSAPLPALRSPPAPPAAPRVLERRARGSGGSLGRPGARARRQWGGARPASPRERKGCGETPRRVPAWRVGRGASRDAPLGSPNLATRVLEAMATGSGGGWQRGGEGNGLVRRRPPTLPQAARAPGGDRVWRVARGRCLGM